MREALILGLVMLAACVGGSPIATGGAGGVSGSGGSTASMGGTGGAALGGDALPKGAVSFFNASTCPAGWSAYEPAAGRFVVPTTGNAVGGIGHGVPLASGENRTHTHEVTASWMLDTTSYVGVAGGGNHGVGEALTVTLSTTSDPASAGLPYLQLLACKKDVPAVPRPKPLPAHLTMFFDDVVCPDGWKQIEVTQGRFVVGLPDGAPADATFGGPSLGGPLPQHTHGNDVTLDTDAHGIALASGCCGGGYAADGAYLTTQDTSAADPAVPYVELIHCEKL